MNLPIVALRNVDVVIERVVTFGDGTTNIGIDACPEDRHDRSQQGVSWGVRIVDVHFIANIEPINVQIDQRRQQCRMYLPRPPGQLKLRTSYLGCIPEFPR